MKKLKGLVLIGCTLALAACGQPAAENNESADKLQVITSFYPMQAFTEAVAGDAADVEVMVTGSQDSHSYEPSAQDIAKLEQADLFVYNSDEMETWVPTTIESLATADLTVVETAGGIDLISGDVVTIDGEEHHEGETAEEHAAHDDVAEHHEGETAEEHAAHAHDVDPHTWLDPVLAQEQVQRIADALKEADPDNAETYQTNADHYITELQSLDQEFAAAFAGKANREFLTQHAAFAYLAKRYDLKQIAVTGVSSTEEPSPQRLAELTEYITAHDVKVMYMQAGVSGNISATLANEAGIEVSTLNSLENGKETKLNASEGYLELMHTNLENLKLAIQ